MSPHAVAAKAASLLLRYPDQEVLALLLPPLRTAVAELPPELSEPLGRVIVHRAATDPSILAAEYVELFDPHHRSCLYLSCYTAGDTRSRGLALLRFASVYEAAGFRLEGELPDFLPALLELAAHAGEPGWALLGEHRIGLDLLAQALEAEKSLYRYVVHAVRALLPPPRTPEPASATTLCGTMR